MLFPRSKYNDNTAIQWLKSRGFHYDDIDYKPNFIHFRQHEPKKNSNYITKTIKNGIELIIEV